MDHKTCRENLSAYLDGELPPREKVLLETHLSGCTDCAAVLAGLRSVSGILKRNGMEPVPPSLKGEVLGGLNAKPFFSGWLKPVLALSTAAAGVLVVLNLVESPERASAPRFRENAAFQQPESPKSGPAGLSADSGRLNPSPGGGGQTMPAQVAAAPAASGFLAKNKYKSGTASARGSYGQAKFAAPRALGSLGGAAGAKAEAPARAGLPEMTADKRPGATEFRGPVAVYVSGASPREEASSPRGKALLFLEKSGTPLIQAEPGRLVFIKKDGSRKILTEKDCRLGFIFFDGVRDPLVITDFVSIAEQYNTYFRTSLKPPGDELHD